MIGVRGMLSWLGVSAKFLFDLAATALLVGVQSDRDRENLGEAGLLDVRWGTRMLEFEPDPFWNNQIQRCRSAQLKEASHEGIALGAVAIEGVGVDRDRADSWVKRTAH